MKKIYVFSVIIILCSFISSFPQESAEYMTPPKEIVDLVDAPVTPSVGFSPDAKWMLIMERRSLPAIKELAQPEFRIAGHRINPAINGQSRVSHFKNLILKNLTSNKEYPVKGLPENPQIGQVSRYGGRSILWSPDCKFIAFTNTVDSGIELWIVEIENFTAKKLTEPVLNGTFGSPIEWTSDSRTILCKFVSSDRNDPPEIPKVPSGPTVQENIGKVAPAWTYQDLLKNSYDEKLFEYYFASCICKVTVDGKINKIGETGIFSDLSVSPDGKYILVNIIHHPFSYIVPSYRFPHSVEVWDMMGRLIRKIADIPLMEEVPLGSGSTTPGPRNFSWRADVPSTLYYVEAQDEGDPKKKVEFRDKVYFLEPPFDSGPKELVSLNLRYRGITWCNEKIALATENWRPSRKTKTWIFNPGNPDAKPELLFDRSTEDTYSDPGSPLTIQNKYARRVLLKDKNDNIYLSGSGSSPEGSFPFFDKMNLNTKKTERLWQCEAPYYENFVNLISENGKIFITSRESTQEPPNYFIRDLNNNKTTQITDFPHPFPQMKDIYKEYIKYKRDDGLDLTGTLYLPAGYTKDQGPLPLLIWAYPREFKSARAAGQVRGSKYRFTRLSPTSILLFLTQGYAVLDGAEMPIIGEGDTEPNDTFIKQLVANGKAAIDAVAGRGAADPLRVAVGGHSYGAFMTANLLAHSDLFAAGIARSGAYNRSLTPFGFQNESRTFWEAPEIYFAMSPFMHAQKVNEPLLLIHGEADNNSGTFPIQSKRYYSALKGHGATVRLVMLPHESHGYRARESVLHMLWETYNWLEKYVKNKK
ncbi:S9 family peptidase [candidate division KSB1 bacterium]